MLEVEQVVYCHYLMEWNESLFILRGLTFWTLFSAVEVQCIENSTQSKDNTLSIFSSDLAVRVTWFVKTWFIPTLMTLLNRNIFSFMPCCWRQMAALSLILSRSFHFSSELSEAGFDKMSLYGYKTFLQVQISLAGHLLNSCNWRLHWLLIENEYLWHQWVVFCFAVH